MGTRSLIRQFPRSGGKFPSFDPGIFGIFYFYL
jgi:hypothetical protein